MFLNKHLNPKLYNDEMTWIIPFSDRCTLSWKMLLGAEESWSEPFPVAFSSLFSSLDNDKLPACCCLGLVHHFAVTFDGGWAIVKSILCLGGDQKRNLEKIFNRSQFSTTAPSADSQETLHFLFFATKYKCKYLSCHLLLERQGYFSGFFIHFFPTCERCDCVHWLEL